MISARTTHRSVGPPLVAVAVAASILTGATPGLGQELHVESLRNWMVPVYFSPHTAWIDASVDGSVLLMSPPTEPGGQGQNGADPECVVIVSNPTRTVAYNLRHEFRPTRCIDAVLHPDGGFIIRGEAMVESPHGEEEFAGFSSRVASDGQIVWSVDDGQFAESEHQEAFAGNYVGAKQGLAYDEGGDHVFAVSEAEQPLGNESRSLVQAHTMRGDTGDVVESGLLFGPTNNDRIVDVVARDGEFLVVTVGDGDEKTRLYSHEATVGAFQIDGQQLDGSTTTLSAPPRWLDGVGTVVGWRDEEAEQSGVMRLEGLDSVVWNRAYDDKAIVDGRQRILGPIDGVWVSQQVAVVRHNPAGRQPLFRFLDVDDGTDKRLASPEQLTAHEPIGFARDVEGQLTLMALDPVLRTMWEYALAIGTDRSGGVDSEESAGGCSTTGGQPGWLWLIAAALVWGRSRR